MTAGLSVWVAFGAGVLSFVSPCTLPLFPSYLGYISGISFQDIKSGNVTRPVRVRALTHAFAFVIGLSMLFVLLGWGATEVGSLLRQYQSSIRIVGGVLVVIMGLFMAGIIKSSWLMKERRIRFPVNKPLGYLGSVGVGVIFAAGWTPCIGPILGSVLALVMANPSIGTWYMVAYALGFSVPFLVFAVTLVSIRPLLKYTEVVSRVGGWLLVVMGLLLVTNEIKWLTIWIQQVTGFTSL
ncbi:cytochrome c biogenesis CcdA family protein [Alicyclobacillus sp. SO9]|uniref:cytochrome c biogenesis CcdA family protein n=1 Tax=Alicyclobacillus sp. SO9 TaxID=2665646 RepID=UPI0018E71982|nr:cytochrome c biogenesis protein CcdA [Alicyclobacillus sp. SO9]QQE78051.1 sulfite exporter TauE/SafE family protein [Alicyclobacillus sp. SO9]